jgi:predicted metalloenzyme YecM
VQQENITKQLQNRNAQIAEQEAAQLQKQLEFDLVRFDQQFQQLQGQTNVSLAKSGADMSGTSLRVLRYNAEQAEIQKNIMDYNSKVAQV